jgi:hypothetical protein
MCGEESYEGQISLHCVVKKIYEVIKSVTVAIITTPVLRGIDRTCKVQKVGRAKNHTCEVKEIMRTKYNHI